MKLQVRRPECEASAERGVLGCRVTKTAFGELKDVQALAHPIPEDFPYTFHAPYVADPTQAESVCIGNVFSFVKVLGSLNRKPTLGTLLENDFARDWVARCLNSLTGWKLWCKVQFSNS